MSNSPTAFEIVWRNVWVRAICYVLVFAFLIWLLIRYRAGYLFALQVGIIGFFLAYVLNPLVNLLQKIRIRRPLAVIIVYFLLINFLVLGSVLLTSVVTQLASFINLIPEALNSIGNYLSSISGWFGHQLDSLINSLPAILSERFGVQTSNDQLSLLFQQRFVNLLTSAVDTINSFLETVAKQGPRSLLTGATSIISTTLQIVLIILVSGYFLYDFPKFVESFRRIVPVRYRTVYDDLRNKADVAVGGYIRGQLLITLCLGVFIYIGLRILGIGSALAISFLAAVFNLIPYLGPIIGVIPAVLLGFTISPWTALGAVIVFVIANQLEGNVLGPYILSKSTDLHPVTVLLAILAGAGLFGLVGALLAVPIVALGKVILEEYLFKRPAYQEPALATTSPKKAEKKQKR
ncbi:MAG: AI-2E family transporter [Trueperaceae bacterium]|nr:AI-2E family transporter [Trueperaceae bacterium]